MGSVSLLKPFSCSYMYLVDEASPAANGLFKTPAANQLYLSNDPTLQLFSS